MNAATPPDALLDRAAELMDRELGLRPDQTLRGRLQRCLRADRRPHQLDGQERHRLLEEVEERSRPEATAQAAAAPPAVSPRRG